MLARFVRTLNIMLLVVTVMGLLPIHAQETDDETIIERLKGAVEAHTIQSVLSPDGKQRVQVTVYPCTNIDDVERSYERLEMVDVSTNEIQVVREQLINCGGLGAFGFDIVHWSPDSSYLYFTEEREGYPDGLAIPWFPYLQRVHVQDERVDSLGQALISPSGTWIVLWDQTQISLLSVEGALSDTIHFPLLPGNMRMYSLLWLPNSSGVIYIQVDALLDPTHSTVTYLDLNLMQQTLLHNSNGEG